MSDGELHVFGKRFAAFGAFLGNHVENIVEFALRLLRGAANRMASANGGNIGNVAPVVVAAANDMIIEERFHSDNLAHEPDGRKGKNVSGQPAHRLVAPRAIRLDEQADFHANQICSQNSSTVIPAVRIKLRSVPLAISL
jgi:hypothetical protein